MKRGMAVLAALAIGFTYSPPGAVVLAEENEEKIIETEDNAAESKESEEDTIEIGDSFIDHLLDNLFSTKEEKEALPDDYSSENIQKKETLGRQASGLKNLQIPQKFEVVIDPWEMDGKGQIYSEQYIISNSGDTPGILTLSNLVCRPREQSGVVVRTDKEGLHDSGDKSIYMEMLFRNEERVVFSKESCQYQTELKPGEELPVCFVGEVNENAFGKWENDDIAVSLVYSWEIEKKLTADDTEKAELWIDENSEETGEKQQDDGVKEILEEKGQEDTNAEDAEESLQTDMSSENSEEVSGCDRKEGEIQKPQSGADENTPEEKPSDHDDTVQKTLSADLSNETLNGEEASETQEVDMPEEAQKNGMHEELTHSESGLEITDKEEEEIKNIELREPQKIDVFMDSWTVDEKGKITSIKYMLKNTGDSAGTWSFTELICKPKDRSEIKICTDLKEVQSEDAKTVYMELVLGNGEKVALSQKSSEYEVKLKAGEEISVCFIGVPNRKLLETGEKTDIEITAVCSWNREPSVME